MSVVFIFGLLLATTLVIPHVLSTDYTISTLTVTIDSDGYTNFEYKITTDPTVANITLPLIGSNYTNVLVTDQNETPLDYQILGDTAIISSLGSNVELSYTTQSLTNKRGDLWEMNVTAPTSISVLIPQGATLVSLSQIPLEISTINQRQSLLLPDGPNEITYELGIVGTKEHSLLVITDAETAINQAKANGLVVTSAEALLDKAKSDYNAGTYTSAEDLAGQAKSAITAITALASDADTNIKTATNSIEKATIDGRTNGLDKASSLLVNAKAAYTSGNYTEASTTATLAAGDADSATRPINNMVLYLGAGTVITALLIAAVLLRRRSKQKISSGALEVKGKVNLDSINRRFPNLRDEDKQLIKLLAESGGEAYADVIREKLDMPKTSAWRMIRRLISLGIVGERKVATRSLVFIEVNYRFDE
ncbi:MAG: hypothetical protein ABSA11_09840 [Candidatus Bathyarchaeia archaeon]